MIDIHTHILPGIDDGAEDMTDALLMAELAAESGVSTIIATPHSNIPGEVDNFWSPKLEETLKKLQEETKKREIPMTVLEGMEIFGTDDVTEKIRDGRVISLNDSGRYLIEFGFYSSASRITGILERIRKMGAVPIVAHPERYTCVQQYPELAMEWTDMGCQLQMNKGSIFGKFGRRSFKAAEQLLRNRIVTYIASDAHSPYRRTTFMKDIDDFLREEFSSQYAYQILTENPQRFLIEKEERIEIAKEV